MSYCKKLRLSPSFVNQNTLSPSFVNQNPLFNNSDLCTLLYSFLSLFEFHKNIICLNKWTYEFSKNQPKMFQQIFEYDFGNTHFEKYQTQKWQIWKHFTKFVYYKFCKLKYTKQYMFALKKRYIIQMF